MYLEVDASEVPPGLVFHTPAANLGALLEGSYAGSGLERADFGAPFKRLVDSQSGTLRFFRWVSR